jgi:hypothetical protein
MARGVAENPSYHLRKKKFGPGRSATLAHLAPSLDPSIAWKSETLSRAQSRRVALLFVASFLDRDGSPAPRTAAHAPPPPRHCRRRPRRPALLRRRPRAPGLRRRLRRPPRRCPPPGRRPLRFLPALLKVFPARSTTGAGRFECSHRQNCSQRLLTEIEFKPPGRD